jgi:hypothetical protein
MPATTCASSLTSTRWASTRTPRFSSSADASRFLVSLVPQMTTEAPASARPSARPSPIPPLPPVISATLSLKSNG